jgi:UDP-N-acetylmuramyl tripeptide synthase
VKQIQPKYSLLLNVMRDQLDRFGEIDHTAKLLQVLGRATSGVVVLNGGDPLLGAENFGENFSAKIAKFGSHEKLAEFFPNDDEIHGEKSQKSARSNTKFDYTLEDFSKNSAKINGEKFDLQISGIHNILNLTAAIGLIREILANEKLNLNEKNLQKAIFEIKPAFGRGEIIKLGGQEIEIMLVKNPAGFRSNLKGADLENAGIMIAINDNYADGRDMSWLWDVDFSALKNVAQISGVRAYDMALRLFHDGVQFENSRIETDISKALAEFLKVENPQKKIFATYTAMLEIRKEISKITDVEKIL